MQDKDIKALDLILRAFKRAKIQLDGEEVLHVANAFSHLVELKKRLEELKQDESDR